MGQLNSIFINLYYEECEYLQVKLPSRSSVDVLTKGFIKRINKSSKFLDIFRKIKFMIKIYVEKGFLQAVALSITIVWLHNLDFNEMTGKKS